VAYDARRAAEFERFPTPSPRRVSIRRTAAHPFNELYLACQDIEWWCRVPDRLTVLEHHSPDHVFYGTDHPRVLNSPSARLAFSYLLLDDHPETYAPGSRALAFRLLRIADFESRLGSPVLSLAAFYDALRCHPDWSSLSCGLRLMLPRQARNVGVGDQPLLPSRGGEHRNSDPSIMVPRVRSATNRAPSGCTSPSAGFFPHQCVDVCARFSGDVRR
jgi:hypothetical protein